MSVHGHSVPWLIMIVCLCLLICPSAHPYVRRPTNRHAAVFRVKIPRIRVQCLVQRYRCTISARHRDLGNPETGKTHITADLLVRMSDPCIQGLVDSRQMTKTRDMLIVEWCLNEVFEGSQLWYLQNLDLKDCNGTQPWWLRSCRPNLERWRP